MGIYLRLPDYDNDYKNLANTILLNDVPYATAEDRQFFNNLLITTTEGDVLSSTPTCECGKYQYGYNLGRICEICDTEVQVVNENVIDNRIWIKVPDGIHGFISPYLWIKLTYMIAKNGFNVLLWAVNPKVSPHRKNNTKMVAARIAYLESKGWVRSINYFIENWETFFQMIDETTPKRPSDTKEKISYELDVLRQHSSRFFPKYQPIPTKALMVIEKTMVGNFADTTTMSLAVSAAKTIGVISQPRLPPLKPLSIKTLDQKIADVCEKLYSYAMITNKKNICPKSGWLRSHIYRNRSDFTGRAVLGNISVPHHYNELHIPWLIAVELFRYHLLSLLTNHEGYNYKQAVDIVESGRTVVTPILEKMFDLLLEGACEIPRVVKDDIEFFKHRGLTNEMISKVTLCTKGIPCLLQRNPTLGLGSFQLLYIPKIKRNINDKTISASDLIAPGFNFDHDGDELNITFLTLEKFIEASKTLDIRYAIHDTVNLGKLNNNIRLPAPIVEMFGNFVNERYYMDKH